MKEDCKAKLKDLQKYVPPLCNLMANLKDDPRAAKFKQIEVIHKVLTRPDIGITIDTLVKCEEVLKKVFDNSLKQSSKTSDRSSVDENCTFTTVKDEDFGNSSSISDNSVKNDNGDESTKLNSVLSNFNETSHDMLKDKIVLDDSKQISSDDLVDKLNDLHEGLQTEIKLEPEEEIENNTEDEETSRNSTDKVENVGGIEMHSTSDSKSEDNVFTKDEKKDCEKSCLITDEDSEEKTESKGSADDKVNKIAGETESNDDENSSLHSKQETVGNESKIDKDETKIETNSLVGEIICEKSSECSDQAESIIEINDQSVKIDEETKPTEEKIRSNSTNKVGEDKLDSSKNHKPSDSPQVDKIKDLVRTSNKEEDLMDCEEEKNKEKPTEEEKIDELRIDVKSPDPCVVKESVEEKVEEKASQIDQVAISQANTEHKETELQNSKEMDEEKSEKYMEEDTESNETVSDKNAKLQESDLKSLKEKGDKKSEKCIDKLEEDTENSHETASDQHKELQKNDLKSLKEIGEENSKETVKAKEKSKESVEKMEIDPEKHKESAIDQEKTYSDSALENVKEKQEEKQRKTAEKMEEETKYSETADDQSKKGDDDLKNLKEKKEEKSEDSVDGQDKKGKEKDLNYVKEKDEEKLEESVDDQDKKGEKKHLNNVKETEKKKAEESVDDQDEKCEENNLKNVKQKEKHEGDDTINPNKTNDDDKDENLLICREVLSKETISKEQEGEKSIEKQKKNSPIKNDKNLLVEITTARKEKSKENNKSSDTATVRNNSKENTNTSSDLIKIGGSDGNGTIKTIELKAKDPSEKPAVVYLVKKGAQRQMETIELLDSDSGDDDDVILVSAVGLKRRPTVPKPIVQKNVCVSTKFPRPKVLNVSTPGKGENKTMFAITSVKSIGRVVKTTAAIPPQKSPSFTPPPPPPQRKSTNIQGSFQKSSTSLVFSSQKSAANSPIQKKDSQVPTKSTLTPSGRNSRDNGVSIRFKTSLTNKPVAVCKTLQVPNKDDKTAKALVDDFLTNILTPSPQVKTTGIDVLLKVLDFPRFCRVKSVIESTRKSFVIAKEKGFKPLTSEIIAKHEEVRSMFIRSNNLTEIGQKLAAIVIEKSAMAATPAIPVNGAITKTPPTNRNRKRSRNLQDDEYAPDIAVESVEETVADRIKSLRRECKTNRKQYFAYEDDDDTQFLEMLEDQARLEANVKKKRTTPVKRSNGSTENNSEVKKLRLEEGYSFDSPFETDLLTPTWVEGPADGQNSTVQLKEIEHDEYEQPPTDDIDENYYQEEEQEQQEEYPTQKEIDEQDGLEVHCEPVLPPGKPYKNINRAHHCRSQYIDSCVLCGVKHNFVVAHYVNQHRETEVLISRLTQRDTDQLLTSINYGYLSAVRKATNTQYSATCIFCKREMTFTLRYWWEHYTMHTGEYSYECSKCTMRRPRRQHAQRHASNECKLGAATVKVRYHFDKLANRIQAFVCRLCNYIQLHEDNVVQHYKTQHDKKRKSSGDIIRVVLLQISRPYQDCFETTDYAADSTGNNSGQFETGESSFQGYEDYADLMLPTDDLSYRICDMLATEDPSPSVPLSAAPSSEPFVISTPKKEKDDPQPDFANAENTEVQTDASGSQ